jgi:WD40 repeat protein
MKIQFGSGVVSILNAHGDRINQVHFSPDDKIIASASRDKTLALGSADGAIILWNLDELNHLNNLDSLFIGAWL